MRSDVSALYIDPRGPYPKLVEDWWDEERDARHYFGPNPIVAHPPCGPWGRLRHLCRNQPVDCAPIAVEQVRLWGGVIEHPAHSKLFDHLALPKPGDPPDPFGGRTFEVEQVRWGHVARKRTWLYCVGIDNLGPMPPPREPTHWLSGGRGHAGKKAKTTPVPPGIRVASEQQRRRTPLAFATLLLDLASTAKSRL